MTLNVTKNSIKLGAIISLLCVTLVTGSFFILNTNAEIFINPKNTNQEKALYYKIKPGDTLFDSFDITNISEENTSFNIQANDIIVTDTGSVTLTQNKEENKYLASWISVLSGAIITKPNSKVNIPLKIEVPKDTKSGEYGAGISLTLQNKDNSSASVKNTVRKGLKLYVLVEGDKPILSAKVNSLTLLNPQSENKTTLEKKLPFWDKNNIVFNYKAQDLGNTFAVVFGKYTITSPDSTTKTGNFSTSLVPSVDEKEYFIATNLPYQSGKTAINIEYQVQALNKDEIGEAQLENTSGSLSDEINLNDKTLSQFRGVTAFQKPEPQFEITNHINTIVLSIATVFMIGLVLFRLFRNKSTKLTK